MGLVSRPHIDDPAADAARRAAWEARYGVGGMYGPSGVAATSSSNTATSQVNIPKVTVPQASRLDINSTSTPQEIKLEITSAVNAWIPMLYGSGQIGSNVFAAEKSGDYLYLGVWFCLGEIEEFTKIRINDEDVPGDVTINEYTGTTVQTADALLAGVIAGYNDTLVLDINGTDIGVAYLVAKIPKDLIQGFPRITAEIKGNKNIFDPRDSSTGYSDNPALCFRDWVKSTVYGPGYAILDSTVETAADFCDEVPADDWVANTAYELGDFCKSTGANDKNRMYECTSAGTSHAADEPTWADEDDLEDTIADNTVEWTCRDGRRHVCGMLMDQKADISSWIETWRTACGCMINWGESGIEMIPDKARATDHTLTHAAGDFLESPGITIQQRSIEDSPTVVQVIYTDTSATPWRDGTDARVAAAGVDAGTTANRESTINAPWIHRKSEAMRLATERLNAATLTDISFSLPLADEALKIKAGDVVAITHPIGLSSKLARVMDVEQVTPGRWNGSFYEYDPAVYSNHLEAEPTSADFVYNSGIEIPKIFSSTPTTPYKVGDLWSAGSAGDLKICTTARSTGAYVAGDWGLASEYDKTQDHIAPNLQYNGDFELDADAETDPTYWTRSISGTPANAEVLEPAEANWPLWKPEGHCFYANIDDANDYVGLVSDYFIPVTQDSYYCLSAWVKTSNSKCYVGVRWYDKDYNALSIDYVCMDAYQATEAWEQKISDAFKPSDYEATARYVKVYTLPQYKKIGYTMISRIQLVESKTSTKWETSYAVAPGADGTQSNMHYITVSPRAGEAMYTDLATAIAAVDDDWAGVYLKNGTYTLTDKITLPDKDIDIIGESEGGVIIENVDEEHTFYLDSASSKTYRLCNFTIDSQNTSWSYPTYQLIHFESTGSPRIEITNVTFYLTDDTDIDILAEGDVGIRIVVDGISSVVIVNKCNFVDGNYAVNIHNAGKTTLITECTLKGQKWVGINTYSNVANVSFNTVEDFGSYGLYLNRSSQGGQIQVTNNSLYSIDDDLSDTGTSLIAIYVSNFDEALVASNTIEIETDRPDGASIHGLSISDSDRSSMSLNTINILCDNSGAGFDGSSDTSCVGIYMGNVEQSTIEGNSIKIDNADVTWENRGIHLNTGCLQNYLHSNVIDMVNNDAQDTGLYLASGANNNYGHNLTYNCGDDRDDQGTNNTISEKAV